MINTIFTANRQRQERIRQGKARPLTLLQAVFAGFLSFFESPAPAVSKQVQTLSSDSNSASITQRVRSPIMYCLFIFKLHCIFYSSFSFVFNYCFRPYVLNPASRPTVWKNKVARSDCMGLA